MDSHRAHYLSTLLVTLVILPVVVGSPCDRISDSTDCLELWNTQLPVADKTEVIATMITNPEQWNANLPPAGLPPSNTPITSNEYVQNAWIRILAITPSAYEKETLLSPGYGTLAIRANYNIIQPSGTERGDCKTSHALTHTAQTITVLNAVQLAPGHSVFFSTYQDSLEFVSTLTVKAYHTLKHYQWKRIGHQRTCAYSNTEHRTKTLITTDTLSAKRHHNILTYNLTIEDEYWNTTQFNFYAENHRSVHLEFGPEMYYEQQITALQPFLTHSPYYALQYRVIPVNHNSTRNLKTSNETFWVYNFRNCNITLVDYFTNATQHCAMNIMPHAQTNDTFSVPRQSRFSYWETVSRILLLFSFGWLLWRFTKYIMGEFDALLNY